MLPPNGVKRTMALVAYGATTLAALSAGASYVDGRYAKSAELGQIHQEIRCIARDLKVEQLQTREILLVNDQTSLEVARQSRTLTPGEIQTYNRNAAELGDVQSTLKSLREQSGCP